MRRHDREELRSTASMSEKMKRGFSALPRLERDWNGRNRAGRRARFVHLICKVLVTSVTDLEIECAQKEQPKAELVCQQFVQQFRNSPVKTTRGEHRPEPRAQLSHWSATTPPQTLCLSRVQVADRFHTSLIVVSGRKTRSRTVGRPESLAVRAVNNLSRTLSRPDCFAC